MTDAPHEALQEAHTLMCGRILEILQNPDATVQELKLAAEWLKQNKIEALPVQGSPMGKVAEAAVSCIHEWNPPKLNQVTATTNLASPIKFPSFPAGDILDNDDPVIDPPTVILGNGKKLGGV